MALRRAEAPYSTAQRSHTRQSLRYAFPRVGRTRLASMLLHALANFGWQADGRAGDVGGGEPGLHAPSLRSDNPFHIGRAHEGGVRCPSAPRACPVEGIAPPRPARAGGLALPARPSDTIGRSRPVCGVAYALIGGSRCRACLAAHDALWRRNGLW